MKKAERGIESVGGRGSDSGRGRGRGSLIALQWYADDYRNWTTTKSAQMTHQISVSEHGAGSETISSRTKD